MQISETILDKKSIWYFGNNRSPNLRLFQPRWNAPFFLTTNYKYAQEYSDYGVYTIILKNEIDSKILDFNSPSDVKKLHWPKILIDKIKDGKNDLNSISYDMYILANQIDNNLMYIQNTADWRAASQFFKKRSPNIWKYIKPNSVWGSEHYHQFLLQMWKDIYDAGFDGFTHTEFGNKILAIFNFHCIDKISIKPINKSITTKLNETANSENDMGEVSDGYHTFNELYYYRMLYNAAFFNLLSKNNAIKVLKSKLHSDGKPPFNDTDMFIVQAELPTGQISNHYHMEHWDKFKVNEAKVADVWDGHTPQQAAERIKQFILQFQ